MRCLLNIWGTMLFLRLTWVVGQAGRLKLEYPEKATKFRKISTLLLSYVVPVKSKVEISQNFVALSKCMNFIKISVHYQEIAIGNFENVDYHFSENNT